MHRCRRIIILVDACADGNTERNENTNKANHAKGNAARVQANLPQGRYESVDSKNLVKMHISGSRAKKTLL